MYLVLDKAIDTRSEELENIFLTSKTVSYYFVT